MKFFIAIAFILLCAPVHAREVGKLDCTIESIIDRTLIVDGNYFRPSGYAPTIPKWLKPGFPVTITYACDEIGDCFYIDVVPQNEATPIGDKINSNLLDFKNIFHR